jgi:hypothetical protein
VKDLRGNIAIIDGDYENSGYSQGIDEICDSCAHGEVGDSLFEGNRSVLQEKEDYYRVY